MGDFVNAKKQGALSLHEPITDFVLYEPETEAVLVVESDKPVKKTRRVAKCLGHLSFAPGAKGAAHANGPDHA